jgi:hypothetical protein
VKYEFGVAFDGIPSIPNFMKSVQALSSFCLRMCDDAIVAMTSLFRVIFCSCSSSIALTVFEASLPLSIFLECCHFHRSFLQQTHVLLFS